MKTEQVYRIINTGEFWWLQGRTLYYGSKWDSIKYFYSYEEALVYLRKLESYK